MASARHIGVLVLLALASRYATAAPRSIIVTGDRVCLRARPSLESEIVGQVMTGDLLTTPDDETTEDWVRVVAPPSVDLWVYSELIRDGRITVNKAQVRGGQGLQFQRVGELIRDTPVVTRGALGDWTRIAPTSECYLWISREFTTSVPSAADAPPPDAPPPAVEPEPITVAAVPPPAPAPVEEVVTPSVPPAVPVALPDEPAPAPALPEPRVVVPPPQAPATPVPVAPPAPAVIPPSAITLPGLPPQLAGYTPDARRPQNRQVRFSGRLERIPYAKGPGYSGYQLVANTPRHVCSEPVCRLIGLEGQLKALVGCQVEVQGAVWHLAGEPVPVLDVRRLLTLEPPP